jgi:hypothetical protein
MLNYNVTVHTERGRRTGFHSLGGRMKQVAWPESRENLGDGDDIYSPRNVFALEKALAAAQAGLTSVCP